MGGRQEVAGDSEPGHDLVHALTPQIPDPRQHLVRCYGAHSKRARRLYRTAEGKAGGPRGGTTAPAEAEGELASGRRRSWARLLRRILEVKALVCPRCGVEMRIVPAITDPVAVDSIPRHVEGDRGHGLHAPRGPSTA